MGLENNNLPREHHQPRLTKMIFVFISSELFTGTTWIECLSALEQCCTIGTNRNKGSWMTSALFPSQICNWGLPIGLWRAVCCRSSCPLSTSSRFYFHTIWLTAQGSLFCFTVRDVFQIRSWDLARWAQENFMFETQWTSKSGGSLNNPDLLSDLPFLFHALNPLPSFRENRFSSMIPPSLHPFPPIQLQHWRMSPHEAKTPDRRSQSTHVEHRKTKI